MSQTNETNEEKTNMERLREDASACGPGCSCHTGGSGRARWIVGAIVIVLAGVLVARAAMKDGKRPAKYIFRSGAGGGRMGAIASTTGGEQWLYESFRTEGVARRFGGGMLRRGRRAAVGLRRIAVRRA